MFSVIVAIKDKHYADFKADEDLGPRVSTVHTVVLQIQKKVSFYIQNVYYYMLDYYIY